MGRVDDVDPWGTRDRDQLACDQRRERWNRDSGTGWWRVPVISAWPGLEDPRSGPLHGLGSRGVAGAHWPIRCLFIILVGVYLFPLCWNPDQYAFPTYYTTNFRLGSLRGGLEGTKATFFGRSGDWSVFLVVVVWEVDSNIQARLGFGI